MVKKEYYGGAFDIDPYLYWTREDLNELQSEIETLTDNEFSITSIYLEDDKIFDIDYTNNGDDVYHLEEEIVIDKRKVQTAKELCQVYAPNS